MNTRTELTTRTPETALELVRSWQNAGDRKRRTAEALRDRDRETLLSVFAAYVRLHARGGSPSPHTLKAYARGAADLMEWTEAGNAEGRLAHQLTREDALAFRLWLSEVGGRENKPLRPASVNARLAAVRAFCEALLWAGVATANPFAGKGVTVRDPQDAASKRDPYTLGELNALLAIADPRERALVLLGCDAGLRLSEAAGLTWGDTDLGRRRVSVTGKGNKRATVAITPRLAEALAALGTGEAEALVLGVSGRRVQQLLAALCERANVTARGYHALRHSAGTRLYAATRDLHVTARHLRHSSVDTTRVYAKLAEDDYAQAVDRLGELTRAA